MVKLEGPLEDGRHGRITEQLCRPLQRLRCMAVIRLHQNAARKPLASERADLGPHVQNRLRLLIRLGGQFRLVDLQIEPFVALEAGEEFGFGETGGGRTQLQWPLRKEQHVTGEDYTRSAEMSRGSDGWSVRPRRSDASGRIGCMLEQFIQKSPRNVNHRISQIRRTVMTLALPVTVS